ncbi:5-bromo-4-chloroindolyl phosphate hydrolysis family protein [Enterobacter sp. Bisph1]|uniref:5-bromo-4-chloroindolyl phosphate hydrolysis family protein n=1 Tax=Enterobacter sp. Bisph1 TaxID=1274399 RepID=UPI00057C2D2E|nr:5-bromo-4-chloroindolyl phosphate hydrolysis family protein [Enterobacter sp. Bisph1]
MLKKLANALDKISCSIWMRIILHCILFICASVFSIKTSEYVSEVLPGIVSETGWVGALLFLNWMAFSILCRGLLFDRPALGLGASAGIVWLFFGDAAAMPFWAATMTLLYHLYRSRRNVRAIHFWYLFLGIGAFVAYRKLYSFTAHPVYLSLFILLPAAYYFIKYVLQNVEARKQRQQQAMQENLTCEREAKDAIVRMIFQLERIDDLPALLQSELRGITRYASMIEKCMREDKRDEVAGRQFLERYLPMVEMVVTKGASLSLQLPTDKQEQAFNEQLAALQKLTHAFYEKHQELLINDQTDLQTELSTLDKMLKTDGYSK